MAKKAVTLEQLEEALRDFTRWMQDKLSGYITEPAAEGQSGWVLTSNGAGGRSWEPRAAQIVVGGAAPEGPALWFDTGGAGDVLDLDEDESGYAIQAVVDDEVYGVENATLNSGAAEGTYDFTVI